jgi:hypothetical protein
MKKILFILLFTSSICFGQNTIINDTIKDSLVKSSWYARVMPYSIVTGAGSLNSAIYLRPSVAQYVEFGKSYGPVDLGLSVGSYTANRDTSTFVEFKITMDASQYGVFSNEFNLGVGKIYNSNTPIMLEASYTIMAQIYKNIGFGVSTGFYDFVGKEYDVTRAYYGLFFRYGLPRNGDGNMYVNRTKGRRRKKGVI